MSTPPSARKESTQHEQAAHLIERLKEELAGVEIERVEVSEAERHGRRLTLTVTVEEAEAREETEDREETEEKTEAMEGKSWSEKDPEGFEEAIEYLLEKNRELLQRLA